jgi:hypothetical protein
MRAFAGAFSLVGILVTLCVCLFFWKTYEYPVMKTAAQVTPIAQQMSGHDENNQPADRTITYEPDEKGSTLKGLVVKTLVPGGAMEKHFGLAVGDEIVQIGAVTVDTYNDAETAEAMVLQDAFEGGKMLKVQRNGETLILPKGADPDGGSDLGSQLGHIKIPSP